MIKKLKIKFICINMTIVMAMLLVIFGMVINFTAANLEADSVNMMQSLAQSPSNVKRPGNMPKEVRLPYFTIQISSRGDVVTDGGEYFDLSDEDFVNEVTDIALSSEKESGLIKKYSLRFYRSEKPGGITIVYADVSSEIAATESLIGTCAFIGVISFVAFLGVSILLSQWAIKPVDKAWKQQKQFVADASHELKTPLTVILTNAELLQEEKYGEEEKKRFGESIYSMAGQMRGLVENLLDLARVDNGTSKMVFAPANFSDVVYEAILPFEPLYFEKNRELFYRIDKGIMLNGSAEHLKQVADILLDNALKYSFENTAVRVELIKKEKHCLLTVKSIGENISKEDLKNIFKRFYRVDKARSMDQSYGLGLSIAESIITEHKGKIWAESKGNENTFFVQLPI